MPASMMRAPTGSSPKVTSRSMVMVAMGPTPGSTPMSVPTRQPTKASPRFCAERAVEKPSARLERSSVMRRPSQDEQPGEGQHRDGKPEQHAEEQDAEGGDGDREDGQLPGPALRRGRAAHPGHQRAGHRQA